MDSALSLLPLPERKKRGPAPGRCERGHPLWRAEYIARGTGPVCGGPIRHPLPPAALKVAKRPVEDVDDQMELFAICVIKVRA